MGTHTLNKKTIAKRSRSAATAREWNQLCRKALAAAEKAGDRRAEGLRSALDRGREKQVLTLMHIICENDISREFPGVK